MHSYKISNFTSETFVRFHNSMFKAKPYPRPLRQSLWFAQRSIGHKIDGTCLHVSSLPSVRCQRPTVHYLSPSMWMLRVWNGPCIVPHLYQLLSWGASTNLTLCWCKPAYGLPQCPVKACALTLLSSMYACGGCKLASILPHLNACCQKIGKFLILWVSLPSVSFLWAWE